MTDRGISFSARLGEVLTGVHREPRVAAFLEREADERAQRIDDDERVRLTKARLEAQEQVHLLLLDLACLRALL